MQSLSHICQLIMPIDNRGTPWPMRGAWGKAISLLSEYQSRGANLPTQSTRLRPSTSEMVGVSRCKKIKSAVIAMADIGTLIQKHSLHVTYWVKTPPIKTGQYTFQRNNPKFSSPKMGPIALANAHVNPTKAK